MLSPNLTVLLDPALDAGGVSRASPKIHSPSLSGSSTTVVATGELTVPIDYITAVDFLPATPQLCSTSGPVSEMPNTCAGTADFTDYDRNMLLYFDIPNSSPVFGPADDCSRNVAIPVL